VLQYLLPGKGVSGRRTSYISVAFFMLIWVCRDNTLEKLLGLYVATNPFSLYVFGIDLQFSPQVPEILVIAPPFAKSHPINGALLPILNTIFD